MAQLVSRVLYVPFRVNRAVLPLHPPVVFINTADCAPFSWIEARWRQSIDYVTAAAKDNCHIPNINNNSSSALCVSLCVWSGLVCACAWWWISGILSQSLGRPASQSKQYGLNARALHQPVFVMSVVSFSPIAATTYK